jgi:O-antigen/teichoic acid export membrane protein
MVSRLIAHMRLPLYRNGYALAASSILTSGFGMVYWILAARIYPAYLVGLNSAMIAAMMFLGGVAQLNLANGSIRFIPAMGKATLRFVVIAYLVSLTVAALVSLGFLSGLDYWAETIDFLGENHILIVWFILSTMGWCIFVLQDGVLTGLRRATWVPVENTIFSIVKIVLMLLFAASLPVFGLFASWSVGLAITLLPTNYFIFRKLIPLHIQISRPQSEPLQFTQVSRYVAGDYMGALAWLACTQLLPVIVTQVAGPTANAFFYLSWQIAVLLFTITSNMGSSLIVEAAANERALRDYTRRTIFQQAAIIIPSAVVLSIGAPLVLQLFGKTYASEGATLLRLLALAAIPNIVVSIFISVSRVQRKINRVVLILVSLSAAIIISSYILLHAYGIIGVGYAWLGCQSLAASLILIFLVTTRKTLRA